MNWLSQSLQSLFSSLGRQPQESEDSEGELKEIAQEFEMFFNRFRPGFGKRGSRVEESVRQYICGLFQSEKRNMERMVEVVVECDYECLQYSLCEAEWDEAWLLEELSREANHSFGRARRQCANY